jgi:transcriptional regulator with XRE-family HTH domain
MTISHWTEKSLSDYLFSIRFDFVYQLEKQMEQLGWNDTRFASEIGVTKGRVSQILNNRDNMTVRSMIKCARALGLKVSVMAYDDGDKDNKKGPIPADIFRICWERQGKPADMWDLQQASTAVNMTVSPTWLRACEITGFRDSPYQIGTTTSFNIDPGCTISVMGDSGEHPHAPGRLPIFKNSHALRLIEKGIPTRDLPRQEESISNQIGAIGHARANGISVLTQGVSNSIGETAAPT